MLNFLIFFLKFSFTSLIFVEFTFVPSLRKKSELFEEVLFQRLENKKMNSIITMNYDGEYPNNMEYAINKLSRYGGRVFDRILGNFNFIELHGKSFRI